MNTFNTGKVRIGLLYAPPMPAIYGDGYLLQSALLDKRSAQPLGGLLMRIAGAVWRWA